MDTKGENFWRWFLFRLKNKYFLTSFIFLLWIVIFDSSNLIDMFSTRNHIKKLNSEKIYYKHKIEEDSRKINELRTNRENLEKFAREQYLMKKPNEDLFIIDESKL